MMLVFAVVGMRACFKSCQAEIISSRAYDQYVMPNTYASNQYATDRYVMPIQQEALHTGTAQFSLWVTCVADIIQPFTDSVQGPSN
jgi:hypothetical protein